MILYHLSERNLGKEYTFVPRIPDGQSFSEQEKCHDIKRLCCAPSIKKCLLALCNKPTSNFYVYRVSNPNPQNYDSKTPKKVTGDWKFTNEVWITQPTTFHLFKKINVIIPAEVKWVERVLDKESYRIIDYATKIIRPAKYKFLKSFW